MRNALATLRVLFPLFYIGEMMGVLSSLSAPWLSVVIPSYCGERWIGTALKSISEQDVQGIEVLVIDSSPTDQALDIASSFSGQLSLRAFKRLDLSSWQKKTNFGVLTARSNNICWLGVDDIWLPGRAIAARSWIEKNSRVSLHLAPSVIIDKDEQVLGVWRCPLDANEEIHPSLVIERLLVQNFIGAPAPVFRRDAWLACGGLDESLWYTADWDMWLKLATIGPVFYHETPTIGFRIHGGSLTVTGSRDRDAFAQQMHTVLERHINKLGANREYIASVARASIAMNAALAGVSAGRIGGLISAISQVLRLGPVGMRRYTRDSRIMERIKPRLKAKLRGVF